MTTKIGYDNLNSICLIVFLLMSTVVWAATTNSSYEVLSAVRVITGVMLSACLVFLFAYKKNAAKNKSTFIAVFAIAFFYTYGFFVSSINLGAPDIGFEAVIGIFLAVVFLYLIGEHKGTYFPTSFGLIFVVSALLILIMTYIMGGLVVDGVPKFVFSRKLNEAGIDVNYSQSVSKFYGLAAIISMYMCFFLKPITKIQSGSLLFLSVVFLSLSALGGGRGDFLAAFIVLGFVCYLRNKFYLIISAGVVILILAGTNWEVVSSDYSIVRRLQFLQSSLGMRDVLALNVYEILSERPNCLLFGCGFGYFQDYFNYPPSLYPHNIFLEMFVVVGLPFTFLLVFLAWRGLLKYKEQSIGENVMVPVILFFFIISIKSGSVFSSWFTMGGLFYLVGMAFKENNRIGKTDV